MFIFIVTHNEEKDLRVLATYRGKAIKWYVSLSSLYLGKKYLRRQQDAFYFYHSEAPCKAVLLYKYIFMIKSIMPT